MAFALFVENMKTLHLAYNMITAALDTDNDLEQTWKVIRKLSQISMLQRIQAEMEELLN